MTPAHLDEGWQQIDEAVAITKGLTDPAVLGRVLIIKAYCQRMCNELEAAAATAREALPLVRNLSLWDRADLLVGLTSADYFRGRFATFDDVLPELDAVASRAGHHGALWWRESAQRTIELARTGDLRSALEHARHRLEKPQFWYVNRAAYCLHGLYLGAVDEALAGLGALVVDQPTDYFYQGMPEATLFAATALAGQHERARALMSTVVAWLPVAGRRNVHGAFYALEGLVTGLALTGDRDHCGALYPLTLEFIRTGQVFATVAFSNPQLVAALAADAAGLADKSREHFETALRQARDVPIRILQPTVLYWYGRALSVGTDPADRARGRAMVEAALTDFRALEMVLHANLAAQFLRDGASEKQATL